MRKKQFRLKPICVSLALAFVAQTTTHTAQANPIGAAVVNGQASFATKGNTLTVTNTPGTIINWQGFSIGANEITRFAQQSASSAVLNRVIANNPSNILGSLQSNGRVFLVNPSGIVFGASATVNVAGMVASTLNLSNEDFLAGRYRFSSPRPLAGEGQGERVVNNGNLTAQNGGQIYLIAPNVENTGIVNAPNGEILLAAGHSVELVNSNDPNLRVNITAPAGSATNVGQLVASSGSLGLFGAVVKNSGTVNANSATLQGGKIVFKASQRAEVSGTVTADGITGGTIQALGNQVGIMDGATVTANGTQGGGTVLVGGDYQGKNPDVQNAQVTYVASTASISADGGVLLPSPAGGRGAGGEGIGNGGKLIVWSDDTTRVYGNLSAKGGVNGGNGGFIETSGKLILDAAGIKVNAGAGLSGMRGQWLLDPSNITITHSIVAGTTIVAGLFDPATSPASITDFDINAALNGATDVTIQTSAGIGGTGAIVVNGTADAGGAVAISNTAGGARSFTLNTAGTINIHSGASIAGSTGNALNVTLNATGGNTIAGTINSSGGGIALTGATTLSGTLNSATLGFGGGNLNLYNGAAITGGTISASGADYLNLVAGYSATLDGVTLNAPMVQGHTSTLNISNGLTLNNALTMYIGPNNANTYINFNGAGAQTLSGTGGITTADGGRYYSPIGYVQPTAGSLVIGSGITIRSSTRDLQVGNATLGLTNNGTLQADGSTMNVTGSNWSNAATGVLKANGGTLSPAGSWTNSGLLTSASGTLNIASLGTNAGIIEASTGTITTGNSNLVNASTGTIRGTGTLTFGSGTLTNSGTVRPGGSATAGTLNITGNFTNSGSGIIEADIGGATVGTQYDRLAVSGSATLGGTLTSTLINGFTPSGQSFDVITAGSASGSFATSTLPSGINAATVVGSPYTYRLAYCAGVCWDGGAGTTNWTDAANWNADTLPGSSDIAYLNLVSGVTVNLANSTQVIKALNSDANNHLAIGTGGVLTVSGAGGTTSTLLGNLTLNGGTLTANGALSLSASPALSSGGKVNLPSGASLSIAGQAYTIINSLGSMGSTTGTDLQGMNGGLSGKYVLGSNIDASATSGWNAGAGFVPIGIYAAGFTGTFDGLGHTVSNLFINQPGIAIGVGLFGVAGTGSAIKNLGLVGGSVTGFDWVGGLAGGNYGTISNSYATGSVSGHGAVGGLVGDNYSSGAISNSYATGNVSNTGNYTGGLVGSNEFGGTISNSYATGSVSGGIGFFNVGGLAGRNHGGGSITNSYATGSVSGSNRVGGLVGNNYGSSTVSNSYSTGSVSGSSYAGGLVGRNSGTVSTSYWNTATSLQATSAGGTGLTTAQMQTAASLTGFNFTTTPGAAGNNWVIVNADGTLQTNASATAGATYPMLASEYSTIINNAHQLQLMEMALGASYTLGSNIDASKTATSTDVWGSSGFVPVGNAATSFIGKFDGLNHTISNLAINMPTTDNVGLFGYTVFGSSIKNVGMVGGSVTGRIVVGDLVGNNSGIVSNSFATGSVSGSSYAGGLVGSNYDPGSVSNSYATGNVSATTSWVGGLTGRNGLGNISNSYATGSVVGANSGGLVPMNYGTITNSFWNVTTSGQTTSAGGTALTTAQMMQSASFASWNTATPNTIANTGSSGAVWRIYESHTAPLLTSFMTPLTLTGAPDAAVTYNGAAQSGAAFTLIANVLGAAATGTNAGFYNGYYSTQQGYDLSGGNLTINAAALNAISMTGTRAYDGTANVNANIFTLSGLVGGQTLTLSGTGTVADKNVGVNKPVTLGSLALGDGTGLASNYTFTGGTQTATITAAPLTLSTGNVSKTYDGLLTAAGTATVTGGTLFGGDTLSGGTFAFTDKNAGSGNKIVTASGITVNDGNGGGNYSVTYTNNTASTITPAALTVAANAALKTYDGLAYTGGNGVTYTGLVNGETAAVFGGILAYGGTSQGATNAGSYLITPGGLTSGNYTIGYVDGALTVNKAALSVTANAAAKTYDGLAYTGGNGVAYTGLVNGETAAVLGGILAYGGTSQGAINAGSYLITPGGLTSGNYTLSYVDGALTVNKAALTAALIGAPTKVYDGTTAATLAASNYSLSGFVAGEGATVGQTAGTYNSKDVATATTINATLAANNFTGTGSTLLANYFLPTIASGAGSITPAGLTVTANALSKTVGAVDPLLTYMTAGLQAPDTTTSTLSGALARLAGETVGLYQISQGMLVSLSTNYTMSYIPADFGIVAAPVVVAPPPVAVTPPPVVATLAPVMDTLVNSIIVLPPSVPFNPPTTPVIMQAPVAAPVAPAVSPPIDAAGAVPIPPVNTASAAGTPSDTVADTPPADAQTVIVANAAAPVATPIAAAPLPVCK